MSTILVIDDDRSVRHLVKSGLEGHHGFRVVTAEDGDTGLRLLETEKPSVALLDIFLPEYNGLELFRKMRAIDGKLPVIFITGDTSSETAIEAMRTGAFDYLSKPLNIEQLRNLSLSAAKARLLMDQPVALPVGEADSGGERFVGNSKAMIEVYKDIGRVASQNVTVLIRGESGCGKELVARALVNHSHRRDQRFAAVNCAAIPDQLLESELFGHEKGAFTGAEKRRLGRFEQCDGGTIFLDEVGDMSTVIQGKVLRLLQDQKFERVGGNELIATNVRIIAATNRPLEDMVQQDLFREDLLYRLNGFTINLPPLRDRRDDIPGLLEYFLRRAKSEMERPQLTGISPEALDLLIRYDWPGNVRQLQSVVRQSLLNTTGTVIGADNLPDFVRASGSDCMLHRPAKSGKLSGIGHNGSSHASSEEAEQSSSSGSHEFGATDSPSKIAESGNAEKSYPGSDGRLLQSDFPKTDPRESLAIGQGIAGDTAGLGQPISAAELVGVDFSINQFIDERLQQGSKDLYAETLAQMERRLFTKVLEYTAGNQSKAAEILGITRGKVRDRIAAFDIQLDRKVMVGKP